MNTRKLVGLFFKTMFIGGIAAIVTSFFVKAEIYGENLAPFNWLGLLGIILWYLLYGFLYSIISQAGFFAYLFINRFGLSIFRSFWPTVQILLIAFVVFDLIYFPYQATKGEISILWWFLMSFAILAYGIIIAKIKADQTNQRAFIPTLFLMVVMTAIEWVPGLRTDGTDIAWLMIISLLACNTYQILVLHRLQEPKDTKTKTNAKRVVKA